MTYTTKKQLRSLRKKDLKDCTVPQLLVLDLDLKQKVRFPLVKNKGIIIQKLI